MMTIQQSIAMRAHDMGMGPFTVEGLDMACSAIRSRSVHPDEFEDFLKWLSSDEFKEGSRAVRRHSVDFASVERVPDGIRMRWRDCASGAMPERVFREDQANEAFQTATRLFCRKIELEPLKWKSKNQ